jgi:hypothetical protein
VHRNIDNVELTVRHQPVEEPKALLRKRGWKNENLVSCAKRRRLAHGKGGVLEGVWKLRFLSRG